MAELKRAERWGLRYDLERPDHMRLLVSEVGDDMDTQDAKVDGFAGEMAKIKGILIGILISVSTGSLLLAANLVVGKT